MRHLPKLMYGVDPKDVIWNPDWAEREFERWLRCKAEYDREWLAEQTKRLAAVAWEIDQYKREAALIELQEKQDAWHREDVESTAKLVEMYQKQLDASTYKKLLDRVTKAGKDIEKANARIERNVLKRRGVVRGVRGRR